ncbi:MAG: hypothetical protein ACKN9S_00605 [Pirellula sp.]
MNPLRSTIGIAEVQTAIEYEYEPIIPLYVDCILQNDAPIKQITALMHSDSSFAKQKFDTMAFE